jgi:hypothetical protein
MDGRFSSSTTATLERQADELLGLTKGAKPGPRPKGQEAPDILTERQLQSRAKREIAFGSMSDFDPVAVGIRTVDEWYERFIR